MDTDPGNQALLSARQALVHRQVPRSYGYTLNDYVHYDDGSPEAKAAGIAAAVERVERARTRIQIDGPPGVLVPLLLRGARDVSTAHVEAFFDLVISGAV